MIILLISCLTKHWKKKEKKNKFFNGLAAGIDDLRPQYLKDLIGKYVGKKRQQMLSHITSFVTSYCPAK